jgi:hypothetical protein
LGETPIINTSVDLVLNDIPNLETIIENIKRESTKRKFERLYKVFQTKDPNSSLKYKR